jgi:hypothetical protein
MQAYMAMPFIGSLRLLDVKVRLRNQQALKIVSFDCCHCYFLVIVFCGISIARAA